MPSESDTSRRPGEPAFIFQGTGDVVRFMCPKCGHSRPILGRRLERYFGTRIWICGECLAASTEKTE